MKRPKGGRGLKLVRATPRNSPPASAFCLRLSTTAAENDDDVFYPIPDIHTRASFTFVSSVLHCGQAGTSNLPCL